ncbi:MAG: flagellar biosynthesis anti-sigma factor FlgM [Gammaproteobacteria bacterium]|jgi:flagellar biosynthesis anti-sigma factor FlgM|nr:flagellar biosynthesis anti-sigma factor FlgM [Gammaproteobacteria bacterium]MBT5746523.1 flagellar biosynthesis anti-sigma factor FlgM [Gammaproteobacteria bacterium]
MFKVKEKNFDDQQERVTIIMDIQTSLFQASNAFSQKRVESESRSDSSTTGFSRELNQHADKPAGMQSVAVIDRLTEKLVQQSEQPDRVAAIKAQIAEGTFEIDAGKIADKLLWGERIAALSNKS